MTRIYLDNNASTPVDPEVAEAILTHLQTKVGNPSSMHTFGREVRGALTSARDQIASILNVKSDEIIFTSGGTEALNLTLRGVILRSGPGHIISSTVEHPAVLETLKSLEKLGCEVEYLEPGTFGAIQPEQVLNAIRPETKLITLMATNNETGVKTDITAISNITSEYGTPFIVDGVAWLGKEPMLIPSGVSAICFSGQKIHAPKGVGFAVIRKKLKLDPILFGGSQEFNRRAGTENVPGIIGLAKALDILSREGEAANRRISQLRDRLESGIGAEINGAGPRVCNTVNLAFDGIDGETLITQLDMQGIAVSHGSACASGGLEPSHVLVGMGYPIERVRSSIRFSLSRFTVEEEIDECVRVLKRILG